MQGLMEKLQDLVHKSSTVENLLKLGILEKNHASFIEHNNFTVETIYDKGISIVIAEAPNRGEYFPEHCHQNIVQYLICIKGSFVIDYQNSFQSDIIKEKDFLYILPSRKHKVTALENNSKLVGICIPMDRAYTTQ
jgi:cupin superfamily acireductone dioxygenase involved in methionine salvage